MNPYSGIIFGIIFDYRRSDNAERGHVCRPVAEMNWTALCSSSKQPYTQLLPNKHPYSLCPTSIRTASAQQASVQLLPNKHPYSLCPTSIRTACAQQASAQLVPKCSSLRPGCPSHPLISHRCSLIRRKVKLAEATLGGTRICTADNSLVFSFTVWCTA